MDIPSEALPFKLYFINLFKTYDAEHGLYLDSGANGQEVLYFSDDDYFSESCRIGVKENIDLDLRFVADDPRARLYFDGAECLSQSDRVEIDDQDMPYLPPSEQAYEIYRNDDDGAPLIPGVYRLKIYDGQTYYYASFEIELKQMTKRQWQIMREELEQEMAGLSLTLSRCPLALDSGADEMLSETYFSMAMLYKLAVIKENFAGMMAALGDLVMQVNFQIDKHYHLLRPERAKAVDQRAMGQMARHPDPQQRLLTPVRQVGYDLPENRWLKKILQLMDAVLREISATMLANETFLQHQASSLNNRSKESQEQARMIGELVADRTVIQKMRQGIKLIRQAPWYDQVDRRCDERVPYALIGDVRYHVFYKVYRLLQEGPRPANLDGRFGYQWKSSDLLYEQWGFITIERLLMEMGFEPYAGWIFDLKYSGETMIIPFLTEGTRIQLKRGTTQIDLYYNSVLANNDYAATIYMLNAIHTKPDCRLDIFEQGHYRHSLIIEFKYRAMNAFWKPSKEINRQPQATRQIIEYYRSSEKVTANNQRERAVREVWAVYPRNKEPLRSEFNSLYRVRIMQLTPGEATSDFRGQLATIISEICHA